MPPLCPLSSTGPAIISMRYHEQMRWTMNDERAEPWSKRNEKWIHNFGVQKIDGRTRESRKSHSWLASKVVVYKYCGELFLVVRIWVKLLWFQKWRKKETSLFPCNCNIHNTIVCMKIGEMLRENAWSLETRLLCQKYVLK